MIIGVVKEIKNNENRVGMLPSGVYELVKLGHTVLIEKDAGLGSNCTNEEYIKVGAEIINNAKETYERSELIIKVKEPIEEEYELLKDNQTIFTYLHLAANLKLIDVLKKKNITAIAYETVEDFDGSLPLLRPMSEVAGRMATIIGANLQTKYMGGSGVLLGGIPGVLPSQVVIIGGGVVGTNAAKMALGLGANVTILDISHKRLAEIDDIFDGRINTLLYNKLSVHKMAIKADLLIGAVLVKGKKAPHVLTEETVMDMKNGSVIVDVAIDQGGSIETIDRITTHENPTYIKHGVIHYSVANMPGAVPQTSTYGLTNVTLPYIKEIANLGGYEACMQDKRLYKGLNVYNGEVYNEDLLESINEK